MVFFKQKNMLSLLFWWFCPRFLYCFDGLYGFIHCFCHVSSVQSPLLIYYEPLLEWIVGYTIWATLNNDSTRGCQHYATKVCRVVGENSNGKIENWMIGKVQIWTFAGDPFFVGTVAIFLLPGSGCSCAVPGDMNSRAFALSKACETVTEWFAWHFLAMKWGIEHPNKDRMG